MSFDTLIPDARRFLADLAENNSRDWFLAHKSTYDAQLKTPAQHLLDDIAARLTRLSGARVAPKLFRPHRDIRFSKDKTPYHTHLHMLWTLDTNSPAPPQFFFGIAPGYITSGGGRMGFEKVALAAYRAGLLSHGAALKTALDALTSTGARLSDPELKRPAAPIEADTPLADLARRKSLAVWVDHATAPTPLPEQLETDFARLWPAQQALQQVLAG